MAKFKKPDDVSFCSESAGEASKAVNDVIAKDAKAPRNAMKALMSAFNLFFWPGVPMAGALIDAVDALRDQVETPLNK